MPQAVPVITALAAVAGAGAAVYSATNTPKMPKPPAPPKESEVKLADTTALEGQRQRRAAVAGRAGTKLTGPSGLGDAGTGNTQLSKFLGG